MKYNNIQFGLFISLKSSVQGHSQLSYHKMIHDNKEYHMVFISHVSNEMSKLDAAFLVLNRLFELNNNEKTNLNWIHNQINSHFKELVKVSEKTSFLKDQYLNMESNIKENLNSYYNLLRDYQYDIDKKINNIWLKMNNDFGKAEDQLLKQNIYNDILDEYNDDKSFYILSKIFDKLLEFNINLKIENPKSWIISWQNQEVGEIKKNKTKLILSLSNPLIDIIFVNNKDNENDQNLIFLDHLLKSKCSN